MKMPPAFAVITVILVIAFVASGCHKPAPKTTAIAGTSGNKVEEVKPAASVIQVRAPGCNADVFTQIPDKPDLFIGRQLNVTDPKKGCEGKGWSLVVLQMDWATHRLNILTTILRTPATVENGAVVIGSAVDPYIAKFNGEYWIAFECSGKNIVGGATCMGPFDPEQPTKGLDLDRTYLLVRALSAVANDKFVYSASDPKLLSFQNHLYLYWSAIKAWKPPGAKGNQWLGITVRGMELEEQANDKRLLWGKGMNGLVDSYDPAHNVEVWGVNPSDPRSNQTVDMFSILAIGNKIYATAGVGGSGSQNVDAGPPTEGRPGCVVPDNSKEGCFRLAVAAATTPLGEHIFDGHLAPPESLPSNAQEYARFYRQPDGALFIMGNFFKSLPPNDMSRALPAGEDSLPLPAKLAQWMKPE